MEEPKYDEMGNLINQKKNLEINLVHILIGGMLILIIFSVLSILKNSDKSKIEYAIKQNLNHIENKDINGYESDLSSRIPKVVKDYIIKFQKQQFDNDQSNTKLFIKGIKIISNKNNEAVVLVNMQKEFDFANKDKKYINYKLKHYLYKENNKYKFYKTFMVNNKK